jgi:hypothetical protein
MSRPQSIRKGMKIAELNVGPSTKHQLMYSIVVNIYECALLIFNFSFALPIHRITVSLDVHS